MCIRNFHYHRKSVNTPVLKACKALQCLVKLTVGIRDSRPAVLDMVKDRHDELALPGRHDVAEDESGDLVEIVLVLFTELKDARFNATTEQLLSLLVLGEQAREGLNLMRFEAALEALDNVEERSKLRTEHCAVLRADVVLHEVLQNLLDAHSREFRALALGLSGVDRGADTILELLRHTTGERREDGRCLRERELRIVQDVEEIFERLRHNCLVVKAIEDIVKDAQAVGEALVRLVANNGRVAHGGKEALERLGVPDTSRVIEGKDTEDVSRLQADTGLLDELDDTIFRGDQRHVHLHDL